MVGCVGFYYEMACGRVTNNSLTGQCILEQHKGRNSMQLYSALHVSTYFYQVTVGVGGSRCKLGGEVMSSCSFLNVQTSEV